MNKHIWEWQPIVGYKQHGPIVFEVLIRNYITQATGWWTYVVPAATTSQKMTVYTIPFTLGFTVSIDSTSPGISNLISTLTTLTTQGKTMVDELAAIVANETTETAALAQVLTLVQKLQTDLAAALAGTTLPPAVQAQVDAAFSASNANLAAVQALVTTSTEPTPP